MGLPGDAALGPHDRPRREAEDHVDDDPNAENGEDARVAEGLAEGGERRMGEVGAALPLPSEPRRAKHEAEGCRHLTGDGGGGADDGRELAEMQGEMGERAGNAAEDGEGEEGAVAHPARNRAPEGHHPGEIDAEMQPSRMHHHVGHEGSDASRIAARQLGRLPAIARRDEGEHAHEIERGLFGQEHDDDLHRDHHRRGPQHAGRHVEDAGCGRSRGTAQNPACLISALGEPPQPRRKAEKTAALKHGPRPRRPKCALPAGAGMLPAFLGPRALVPRPSVPN